MDKSTRRLSLEAAFKDINLEEARAVVGNCVEKSLGCRHVSGFPDRRDACGHAFVSIDCDIYQPIAEGLKFFWPLIAGWGGRLIPESFPERSASAIPPSASHPPVPASPTQFRQWRGVAQWDSVARRQWRPIVRL